MPLSYHLISLVCPFFQSLSIVTPGSPLLFFVFFTFLLHLFLFLSPPFSPFPFLFRPSSFAPPFLSFFSLFSFLLSFAPLLFGAPLRPPGGTCPLCPPGYAAENVSIISDSKLKNGKPICPHIPVTRFCGCPLKPSLPAAHPNLHTQALPVSNLFHRSG